MCVCMSVYMFLFCFLSSFFLILLNNFTENKKSNNKHYVFFFWFFFFFRFFVSYFLQLFSQLKAKLLLVTRQKATRLNRHTSWLKSCCLDTIIKKIKKRPVKRQNIDFCLFLFRVIIRFRSFVDPFKINEIEIERERNPFQYFNIKNNFGNYQIWRSTTTLASSVWFCFVFKCYVKYQMFLINNRNRFQQQQEKKRKKED